MEDNNNKNNNSEKLAKLLGIKPRYTMWINIGDLDNNYIKVSDERKYKLIADNRWYFDDYNKCPEIKLEYPDFYKPENFVKLLKLFVSCYATECCFTHIDEHDIIQKGIDFIKENAYTRCCRNKFKQQAQATKWKY